MRHDKLALPVDRGLTAQLPLVLAPLLFATVFVFVLALPLNHDVAWLLEATRRWVNGAELYRDIVEVNPPLIFIENYILSFGQLTASALYAGVCVAIGMSALWVARWRGQWFGLFTIAALSLTGFYNFAQRDHLALIFLTPFLLAPPVSRIERILLGAWAFLGVGLKPHFALIPLAYIAAQCWQTRSIRPAFQLQNLVLGGLCLAWLLTAWLIWPRYFSEIIPLARSVYGEYWNPITPLLLALSVAVPALSLFVARRHRELMPLSVATIAAVAVFFLQGRNWHYHFIPALGLSAMLIALAAMTEAGMTRRAFGAVAALVLSVSLLVGPPFSVPSVIPQGIKSVLFLTDMVKVPYPMTFECEVFHASRYPAFWTIPGAWNSGNKALFDQEIDRADEDIRKWRPEILFEVPASARFNTPFRFSDWLDVSDYRPAGMRGPFIVWLRKDLPASVLERPNCSPM